MGTEDVKTEILKYV